MTRHVRERPRLVAAKTAVATGCLVAAVLAGTALAGGDQDREADLERRLQQSNELQREGTRQLDRSREELDRLQQRLRSVTRSARVRARANRDLRGELRAARGALQRARTE